jgi:hypothetical protein
MAQAWIPRTEAEAHARAAGRRKMIERKRRLRARRIERVIQAMLVDEDLREGAYGSTSFTAQALEIGLATASRDLALARGILNQFAETFEREFDPQTDRIVWSRHYTSFSLQAEGAADEDDFLFTTRGY